MSRIVCRANTSDLDLILDVNTEVYPLKEGETLTIMIADSLTDHASDGAFQQTNEVSVS